MPGVTLMNVADEVMAQPATLASFAKSRLPGLPAGSVFVGAGDSYAAALAGFYASRGKCLALDSYSLLASPETASGRDAVFVSASGKTSSNIAAARRVRGVARRTWALTADGQSRLAGEVDRVVKLPITYAPKAPGILSFSMSLLAVLKMTTGRGHCDFGRALRRAEESSTAVGFGRGTTYFLGNSIGYAVALYAAAKGYELLGARCHAELLEEFPHMEVFSLRREDAVNIFSSYDPLGRGGRLQSLLAEGGYKASLVRDDRGSEEEGIFHSVFVAQLATLKEALSRGLSKPKFLASKWTLEASDRMIY